MSEQSTSKRNVIFRTLHFAQRLFQRDAILRTLLSLVLIVQLGYFTNGKLNELKESAEVVQPKVIESKPLAVDVFEVKEKAFQELLLGFGTVRPDREVILAAQVTGEITQIDAELKVGQSVVSPESDSLPTESLDVSDPGELKLLEINPEDYQEQVDQAGSRIEEAQATIDELKAKQNVLLEQQKTATEVVEKLTEEYQRLVDGKKKGVTSDKDLNLSRIELLRYAEAKFQLDSQVTGLPFQIKAAEQRLAAANSDRERAENDLERTTVFAPFDGILSEVFVEQGQYVRSGEPLVRLTDLSVVEVPISLAFDDYLQLEKRLKRGETPAVKLATSESAEDTWTGKLVRSAPEADTQSRTVQVFVEVEQAPGKTPLLPGAFVHARIDGPSFEEAKTAPILIPRAAVFQNYVYVVVEEKEDEDEDKEEDKKIRVIRKEVELGRTYQSFVTVNAVTNGIMIVAGDRLIVTNLDIVHRDFDKYNADASKDSDSSAKDVAQVDGNDPAEDLRASVAIQTTTELEIELKQERVQPIRLLSAANDSEAEPDDGEETTSPENDR